VWVTGHSQTTPTGQAKCSMEHFPNHDCRHNRHAHHCRGAKTPSTTTLNPKPAGYLEVQVHHMRAYIDSHHSKKYTYLSWYTPPPKKHTDTNHADA
jgi:hypothetical protein